MYLTTPQRYPLFKGVPNSPVMPRQFYQASSPTMSFANPFVQQNTYRPHPSLPTSQRGPIPPQNPYQRPSTPQARITGKTVPSNPPPQRAQGSLPNNLTPKGQNPQTLIQNKPYTRTMPQPNIKPQSAPQPNIKPQSAIPANQQQMIQSLSKENQDLKKKLAEKDLELQKLKTKEEALEQKFKELQDQQKS
ncbi:unnamed protein product (macronuclear) [Paramecium tetraurelia]|uniref:Uncharacterized protein n=1 Tax=Paramecium tetraurelia TaxID=5888 RepID=A0CPR9_PARTE|nr:uncharacterized protein GSPATT00009178001 [Paramecium tetraurelia]CAK72786.1 unnamed protein product [Paramecium tetraurelia]|eukprot:XP_001440183.1 hypothetical protein (macronuclear) [Paramecium tetraurelia strain d4-2]